MLAVNIEKDMQLGKRVPQPRIPMPSRFSPMPMRKVQNLYGVYQVSRRHS